VDKPILLTVGGHTHEKLWAPLSEHYRIAFLSNQSAAYADSLGIENLRLESFLVPDDISNAKMTGLILTSDLLHDIADGQVSLGTGPRMRAPGLNHWFPGLFFDHATAAIARTSACQRMAEQNQVAGILLHEDVTPEGRVLALFGNSRGIPTLHIPHANHFLRPGTGDIHCQTTASYIGAAGAYMEGWYQDCGKSKEFITVVGTPQWDDLYDEELLPSKEFARRAFGIKEDEMALGYAGTWYQMTSAWGDPEADLEASWNTMLETAKSLGAFLLVKMHPGQNPGQERFYMDQMKEAGLRGAVTRKHPKFAARAVDCMVVQGPSNYGVQCSILGAPVVELYQCGARYPDFGPKGTWGDGLAELIGEAIAAGPNKDFAARIDHRNGELAVDRAVEWVRGLCQ